MFDFLDKVLAKLPGNNWKTIFGYLLTLAPIAVPALVGPAKDVVSKVGEVVLAVGVLHKAVKEMRK